MMTRPVLFPEQASRVRHAETFLARAFMQSSARGLPTFIIVGAAKAGTTALYHWLNQHPDVYMSPVKEPHFFSQLSPHFSGPGDDRFNEPIITTWEAYVDLFRAGADKPCRGEASPSYLDRHAIAVPAIRERLGAVKIVILLREPVSRAFSEYLHLVRDGRETLSFRAALDAEEERVRAGWRPIWAHKARGRYAAAVAHYLEAFGRENVGVWLHEEMRRHPERMFREVLHFIGARPDFTPQYADVNIGGVPRSRMIHDFLNRPNAVLSILRQVLPDRLRTTVRQRIDRLNLERVAISAEDRAYLEAYYAADVAELKRLLPDVPFSLWERGARRNAPARVDDRFPREATNER